MAEVRFDEVSKVFKDGTRAVDKLSLDIADGEFMVLVGPSGCGKTTALRMVGGLEEITEGTLRSASGSSTTCRQRAATSRWCSRAMRSIRICRWRQHRVRAEDEEGSQGRDPPTGARDRADARSGAVPQAQAPRAVRRAAPARCHGAGDHPPAPGLPMDEPLSNLDAKLRVQMRAEIKKLQSELGVTTVYVTHDQVEAMTMGDRVSVCARGRCSRSRRPRSSMTARRTCSWLASSAAPR